MSGVNSFCSTRRTIVSAIKNVRQIGVGIPCGFAALPSKPDARSDVYGSASQIDSFIELPLAQRISSKHGANFHRLSAAKEASCGDRNRFGRVDEARV